MRSKLIMMGTVAMIAAASLVAAAPASEPAARVPLVSDEAASPIAAEMFKAIRSGGGNPLTMHRAVANAPELFSAYAGMARALRRDDHVSRSHRELAILRTLQMENGEYEIEQHTRMARSCGLSEAQLAALATWRKSEAFSPEQRAILDWVEGMASPEGPDAASYQALAKSFDAHAIVEITLTSGFYAMSARTTKALGLKSEPVSPATGSYGAC